MNHLEETIEKVAGAAEELGVDLSSEEIAELAFNKLAQEAEAEKEEEGEEEEEEEEGEEEEGEGGEEEAKAAEFISESVNEAAEELGKFASAEDIADLAFHKLAIRWLSPKQVAETAEDVLEEKGWDPADAPRAARESLALKARAMKATGKAKAKAKGAPKATKALGFFARHPGLKKGLIGTGIAAGAGLGAFGLADALRPKTPSYEKAAEELVVQRAREILKSAGFNPDTGEKSQPMSKVALAQNPNEAVDVAALELLESRGWPVNWSPDFLARGKE